MLARGILPYKAMAGNLQVPDRFFNSQSCWELDSDVWILVDAELKVNQGDHKKGTVFGMVVLDLNQMHVRYFEEKDAVSIEVSFTSS
jgi:hypothetical protein